MYTRREFGRLALAGVTFPALGATGPYVPVVAGVRLGAQTYSFRDLPPDKNGDRIAPIVAALVACGVTECELYAPHAEPSLAPPALRQWRAQAPLGYFQQIRKKFDAAGIVIYAYNYNFERGAAHAEIDRAFEMARAVGAQVLSVSTTLDVAQRIARLAAKHDMPVAMHNHSNVTDPSEVATPESFARILKMSSFFRVNLDIGHFAASNYDAVSFIRANHAHITHLHLKDRKRNQGGFTPWGRGDAPIREVLQLLKREQWPVRAFVEYEYEGTGSPVEEVKKCLDYARDALLAG